MVLPDSEKQLDKNAKKLEKKLEFEFKTRYHLKTALTCKSYKQEHPEIDRSDNERLEFLGDSVMKLIMGEHLYYKTDNVVGDMTKKRSQMESNESLAKMAAHIGILEHILIGNSERLNPNRDDQRILANTFEAIIGAMYIDQGYENTRDFFKNKMLWTLVDLNLG